MRNAKVFTGTSHPELAESVASHLGIELSPAIIRRQSNREVSIELGCSVREKDVFIIQSGSNIVNDHLMELMVMVSACRLASARKITVVVPYLPYSKNSKKKKRRAAVTAKVVASMLCVSGIDHIVTMDLHSSQMHGFFTKPLDNLLSEPTIVQWIKDHVPEYRKAVAVAKNAGGAKRVTSLADKLGITFALVHTDNVTPLKQMSRTPSSVALHTLPSGILGSPGLAQPFSQFGLSAGSPPLSISPTIPEGTADEVEDEDLSDQCNSRDDGDEGEYEPADNIEESKSNDGLEMHISKVEDAAERIIRDFEQSVEYLRSKERENGAQGSSKGAVDQHSAESDASATRATITEFSSTSAPTNHALPHLTDAGRASPKPEPLKRATSGTQLIHEPSYLQKPSTWHKKRASRITLVGDVRDKLVFLIDDMINKSSSFLTAAEHLKVQCGAAKIYIIAAHGLFGGTSLAEIELCPYVDKVIVTNTFPIPSELSSKSKKLVQIDVSFVLAEAIRRNHNGESISYLFERSL